MKWPMLVFISAGVGLLGLSFGWVLWTALQGKWRDSPRERWRLVLAAVTLLVILVWVVASISELRPTWAD